MLIFIQYKRKSENGGEVMKLPSFGIKNAINERKKKIIDRKRRQLVYEYLSFYTDDVSRDCLRLDCRGVRRVN